MPLDPLQALSGLAAVRMRREPPGCTQPSRKGSREANIWQDNHDNPAPDHGVTPVSVSEVRTDLAKALLPRKFGSLPRLCWPLKAGGLSVSPFQSIGAGSLGQVDRILDPLAGPRNAVLHA